MKVRNARKAVLARFAVGVGRIGGSSRGQTVLFNAIRLNRPEFGRLWHQRELRFLAYAFAHRQHSRSQILQDLWVCFELGGKRDGFFVEYGATDGLTNSNTWLLEHEFGWRGLLAEPNPVWHVALAGNRSVPIEHRCVASRTGDRVEFIATDSSDPELSGIAGFSQGQHFAAARSAGTVMEVETISLNDLLRTYDAPPVIDYMSIDTEGNELDILQAFDFTTHRPTVMTVEHNAATESEIETLLVSHGYRRVFRHLSQWDSWYVSDELRRRSTPRIYAPKA